MTDRQAHALDVLADTTFAVLATADGATFAVLATADGAGKPWATPVWFAAEGLDRLFWVSWPGSRHSRLIERRPEVALTVFDSTARPHQAFYATAVARQCAAAELDHGLAVFNRRATSQRLAEFNRERITGNARLRPYVAEVVEAWVLDRDAEVDQRAPIRVPSPSDRDPPGPHRAV